MKRRIVNRVSTLRPAERRNHRGGHVQGPTPNGDTVSVMFHDEAWATALRDDIVERYEAAAAKPYDPAANMQAALNHWQTRQARVTAEQARHAGPKREPAPDHSWIEFEKVSGLQLLPWQRDLLNRIFKRKG